MSGQRDPFDGLRREALALSAYLNPWEPLGEIRLTYPSGKVVPIAAMTHGGGGVYRPPPPPDFDAPEWSASKAQRQILLLLLASKRLTGITLRQRVRRGFHDRDGRGGIQELMREGLVDKVGDAEKDVYVLTDAGQAEAEAIAAEQSGGAGA